MANTEQPSHTPHALKTRPPAARSRQTRAPRTRRKRPSAAALETDVGHVDLLSAAAARLALAFAEPGLAAADLAALVPLAERLAVEQARRAFVAALSILQGDLPAIAERGEIRDPDGRPLAAYALWEDCAAALRPPLARHGFALSFRTETAAGALTVAARLSHLGGHCEETAFSMPFDASGWKNPLQAIGSAAAYGKRYAAQALLNLVSAGEDDDARAAGGASLVSVADLAALRAQMLSVGADDGKLASYLGLSSLAALPAARLAEAQAAVAAHAARRVA